MGRLREALARLGELADQPALVPPHAHADVFRGAVVVGPLELQQSRRLAGLARPVDERRKPVVERRLADREDLLGRPRLHEPDRLLLRPLVLDLLELQDGLHHLVVSRRVVRVEEVEHGRAADPHHLPAAVVAEPLLLRELVEPVDRVGPVVVNLTLGDQSLQAVLDARRRVSDPLVDRIVLARGHLGRRHLLLFSHLLLLLCL